MSYTQEQIEKMLIDERDTIAMRIRRTIAAKKSKTGTAFDLIRRGDALVATYNDPAVFMTSAVVQSGPLIVLPNATAKAAEKERDDGEKMSQALKAALLKLAAYAAKLEKAGDALRSYQTVDDLVYANSAWDAARKEKP